MDVEQIKRKYRRNARFYGFWEGLFRKFREQAIAQLGLRPGDVVLDIGCGTGLSFDLVEQAIGPQGQIIGVEVSPDMLARAQEKVAREGWTNVTLLEANAEEAKLEPESVDAVLSYYTHDIMNSRRAVERAVRALRPSGNFMAAGSKRAAGLRGLLLNQITLAYSRPFITNTSGTTRPWAHLEDLWGPLNVEERLWGSVYIAYGVKHMTQEEPDNVTASIAR